MTFWNPGYYNELRKKEKIAEKNRQIEYYNKLARAHDAGEISGQEFPCDSRWMNEIDKKEMLKRNVIFA